MPITSAMNIISLPSRVTTLYTEIMSLLCISSKHNDNLMCYVFESTKTVLVVYIQLSSVHCYFQNNQSYLALLRNGDVMCFLLCGN